MSHSELYSERVDGQIPHTSDAVPAATSAALLALVRSRVEANWFAMEFPETCDEYGYICGTNQRTLEGRLLGDVRGIQWPLWRNDKISDDALLDTIEYLAPFAAVPVKGPYHPWFHHNKLSFRNREGCTRFRSDANTHLARGVAFELDEQLRIVRIGP